MVFLCVMMVRCVKEKSIILQHLSKRMVYYHNAPISHTAVLISKGASISYSTILISRTELFILHSVPMLYRNIIPVVWYSLTYYSVFLWKHACVPWKISGKKETCHDFLIVILISLLFCASIIFVILIEHDFVK